MPNYVKNVVKVSGPKEELKTLKEFLSNKDEDKLVDFNKVFPMPEELRNASAPNDNAELKLKYGFSNWYEFCNEMWGTKWNALDTYIAKELDKEIVYVFQTAWSTPEPIFVELFKKFPNLKFTIMFADEDTFGSNHGKITKTDKAECGYIIENAKLLTQFAQRVWREY